MASRQPIINSYITQYDVNDKTIIELEDANMVKPMIVMTTSSDKNPYSILDAKVPIDYESRKYIHVNWVKVEEYWIDDVKYKD